MTTVGNDVATRAASGPAGRLAGGIGLGVLSATTFGLSGALASGLLETGWSPGAAVAVRVTLGALILLPFGLRSLRGRWDLLRRNWVLLVVYGVVAVAGAQFAYFSA